MDAGAVFGCEVCDGDGVCVECGGVGEIEEPEPGPDPIGIDEFDDMEVGE